MKYKSIIKSAALLLTLCLLATALLACGKARPVKPTDEDLREVGTISGTSFAVPYEELRYLTLKYREAMAQTYGETIWDTAESRETYRAELEAAVMSNITSNYAVLTLCHEVKITHTEEAFEEAVQEEIKAIVDELGGRKEYLTQLESEFMTDHFFRFSLAVSLCENELLYVYTDDLGLIEDDADAIYDIIMDEEQFARTLHIYVENNAGEDPAENRKKAEDIRRQIDEGVGFNTLIGRHSEDFYMTTTNGYYFTRGEMLKEYEDAAFALEIGQISDIVEVPSGYYIIQRLAPQTDYVMKNLETLIQQYQYAVLYNMIDEKQGELSLVLNDFGKSLDLTTIQ